MLRLLEGSDQAGFEDVMELFLDLFQKLDNEHMPGFIAKIADTLSGSKACQVLLRKDSQWCFDRPTLIKTLHSCVLRTHCLHPAFAPRTVCV